MLTYNLKLDPPSINLYIFHLKIDTNRHHALPTLYQLFKLSRLARPS